MNIDELEKLAKAATPGRWRKDRGDSRIWLEGYWGDQDVYFIQPSYSGKAEYRGLQDSDFIASANPDTVLKLCAVVRAAKKSWLNAHTARRFDDELNEALYALEGNDGS